MFSYSRYGTQWDARLLNEEGRVMAEMLDIRPRRQVPWQVPMMGAVVRTVSGVPGLPETRQTMRDWEPAAVRLLPALFPDSPIALDGLDAIYLNSEVALDLRVPQYSALLAWVQAGGHLIVGVEQPGDVNANPWLNGFLPCDLSDVATVPVLGVFQEWFRSGRRLGELEAGNRLRAERQEASAEDPYVSLKVDPAFELESVPIALASVRDGRVVLSSGSRPLVITASRGRGQVTVLTFNPEREPFRSWQNIPWFWARLLDVPASFYNSEQLTRYGARSIDGVFGSMVDSRQISKLPVTWLLVLLIVYLVVIGPLDQYWLKRIRRQMLTWITFPCYVALFSGLIYLIGYKLRAGDTEWNELHVVDVLPRPQGTQAAWSGRTYASLYSPANARYTVSKTNTFAGLRGEYLGNMGGQEAGRNEVLQRGDGFEAEVFVPVWTSQMFVSDWLEDGPHPVPVSLVSDGEGGWRLSVTNTLSGKLGPVWLAVDDRIHEVGEIAPGETGTFRVARSGGEMVNQFVQRHGGAFQSAATQRRQALGGGDAYRIDDRAVSSAAASFFEMYDGVGTTPQSSGGFIIQPKKDLTRVLERGDAVVLAWVDDFALVEPLNRFQPLRNHRYTLLRLAVPLEKGAP
jgi:hypothetical protein